MAEEKKAPGGSERNPQQATTKPAKLRLDQFVLLPKRFCHRDEAELDIDKPTTLRSLADRIADEGLQTPVEFFRDEKGRPVITKGHRRISALRLNAKEKRPGFAPDMEVPAIEVSGATEQDLIVRSVLDNIERKDYSDTDRIRAAVALRKSGVKDERAANALGIGTKTYERLLLVGQHEWMFELVNQNSVPISYAPILLKAAENAKRLSELEKDLKEWVAAKEKEIKKLAKTTTLSTAKQLVKTYISKPLVDHWVAQIHKKQHLDSAVPVPKAKEVKIDAKNNKVFLNVSDLDMQNAPLPELAKLVGEIEAVRNVMLEYIKTRHALKSAKGPQDVAREVAENPVELKFLREAGLGDLADEVELGLMEEAEGTERQAEEGQGTKEGE